MAPVLYRDEGLTVGISDSKLEGTYQRSIFSTLVTDRKTYFRFLFMGYKCQSRTAPFPSPFPSLSLNLQRRGVFGTTTNLWQWHPSRSSSLMTLKGHSGCVYAAMYSPHTPNIVASCSADSSLNIWDTRQSKRPLPRTPSPPYFSFPPPIPPLPPIVCN